MKALLAVLAVVLIAIFVVRQPDTDSTGGEGTGTDSDGGRLGARCSIFADVPVMDRDGRITGPGRYRCGKADGGVDITVFLQVKRQNGWADIDQQPVVATGAEVTRDRPEKDRTVRATGPCAPGLYRTFVSGTVSHGDRAHPVEAASDPVTDPCGAPSGSPSS
jgi:hypothetical protein